MCSTSDVVVFFGMSKEEVRKLREQHQAHVLIQFAKQKDVAETLVPFDHGEGSNFWDLYGNKWIDFSAQLFNLQLGHQHPKVQLRSVIVHPQGSESHSRPGCTLLLCSTNIVFI